MTDDEIFALRRGGHDPLKVYNAYKRAAEHTGSPTVILAKTIKGYGLGDAGEGTKRHSSAEETHRRGDCFTSASASKYPSPDEMVHGASFYKPSEESPEMRYVSERREAMGGSLPARNRFKNHPPSAAGRGSLRSRWVVQADAKCPPPWRSFACSRCC